MEWREKKSMIISVDREKSFDKIQHPFTIKMTQQTRSKLLQHNSLHLIILNRKKKWFSTDIIIQQNMLKIEAWAIWQEKQKSSMKKWRNKIISICRWHDSVRRKPSGSLPSQKFLEWLNIFSKISGQIQCIKSNCVSVC